MARKTTGREKVIVVNAEKRQYRTTLRQIVDFEIYKYAGGTLKLLTVNEEPVSPLRFGLSQDPILQYYYFANGLPQLSNGEDYVEYQID